MLKTTLEQWRMFKAVVDHGGFSQAAGAIHKSQSTIHHAVHKLEESLGLQLLEVKGRKAIITSAGETMLRRASFILDEVAKVESVASTLRDGIETSLKIAVDQVFPQALMYTALAEVSSEYPQLQIELNETALSGSNELLNDGTVELAISPEPIRDRFCENLCDIEFVAVASPQHQLALKENQITLEDLKSHRQIVLRDSATSTNLSHGWLGATQRWTVSHIRTSVDMVSRGLGFAWLPTSHIDAHLRDGQLTPIELVSGKTRSVQLFLIIGDNDKLGPAAKRFLSELRLTTLTLPSAVE